MAELKASKFVFKKKTSNLILPYSEANEGRDDLIKLTVQEAIDMGLIGQPTTKPAGDSEHDDLRMKLTASMSTISELNDKLKTAVEEIAQLTKIINSMQVTDSAKTAPKKKKVTAKKVAKAADSPVKTSSPGVPLPPDELSEQLNQMGLQLS